MRTLRPEFYEMVRLWVVDNPDRAAATLINSLGVDFLVYADEAPLKSKEDMSDPDNWRAGDIVECVQGSPRHTKGFHYEVTEWDTGHVVSNQGELSIIDNDGDDWWAPVDNFKWHSRPSKETK
jgi:hypothetical protein